jgi:hypothetical protein
MKRTALLLAYLLVLSSSLPAPWGGRGVNAQALEKVLVDDPLRRRMIEAGYRKADTLTWERAVEGTLESYHKALGED